MHLEDGRLLIPASRYDELLKVIIIINMFLIDFFNVAIICYRSMESKNLANGNWSEWMKILELLH